MIHYLLVPLMYITTSLVPGQADKYELVFQEQAKGEEIQILFSYQKENKKWEAYPIDKPGDKLIFSINTKDFLLQVDRHI